MLRAIMFLPKRMLSPVGEVHRAPPRHPLLRTLLITPVVLWIAACAGGGASTRADPAAKPAAPGAAPAAGNTAQADKADKKEEARGKGRKGKPSAGPETESANLLAVDQRTPAAEDIQQKLMAPRQAVDAEMAEVLGESARELTRGKPESLLGNLVVDVMREHAADITGLPVDMAFTNLGGLRANLPRGNLTQGAILEVMPFDNALVVFELSGADLADVLARMALRGGDPVSGIRYRLEAQQAHDIHVGGKPLDPAATYRVCTNDYILDGGGNYEALKRARNINRTGVGIRDALVAYIRKTTAAGRKVDSTMGDRVILGAGVQNQQGDGP